MRKFRPLQEPIRLQDLLNSVRSRAEKKDNLEYGRHVARLRRRRRRRRRRCRANAAANNTASHDNHVKINSSWVSFSFLYKHGLRFRSSTISR